jgi:peptidoglycan hydrolase CwlO-like protein
MGGSESGKFIKTIIVILAFLFLFSAGAGSQVAGEGKETSTATLEERENALLLQAELGEEEKQLIVELLNWDLKIEAAGLEQERLLQEIPLQKEMLATAEVQLAQNRVALEEGKARLGRWINHIYRYGALTYLDVVLGASDFNDFVERAEMVGIIIASQAKMLDEVHSFTVMVREQAAAISRTHEELLIKSENLSFQYKEMETSRAGREGFLASLRAQSSDLAARVARSETQWYSSLNSLHYLLANLHTLPLYNLTPGKTELTFSGLRLEYSDEEINRKLSEIGDANLAGFSVRSYSGRFTVTGPASQAGGPDFRVEGNFQMQGDGKVRYQPEILTLAGVPVGREVLGYVSSESGMVIDAGAYLDSFILSGINIEEGRIVITLAFK